MAVSIEEQSFVGEEEEEEEFLTRSSFDLGMERSRSPAFDEGLEATAAAFAAAATSDDDNLEW